MNELQQYITDSPLVQAAVTEAIHRFYYDRVLSSKLADQQILRDLNVANILDTAWNSLPNWRHILQTIPQRYHGESNTNAVSIHGKPKKVTPIEIIIRIG